MRWKILFILGSLVILLSACDGTPQNVSASPTFLHPHIATYSSTVRIPADRRASAEVSCKPGEQMLGGGFANGDLFEYAAAIEASYPSSATTWTVTGFALSSFEVTTLVYCLQTKLPLNIHIVQVSGNPEAKTACPQRTVLLSWGFHFIQAQDTSSPQSDGEVNSLAGTKYALCASNHVLSGKSITTIFNPHSSSHGYSPGGGEATCPTGQIATGGEFKGSDTVPESDATGADFASWSVVAGGDADMTISAICVLFQLTQ